MTYLPRICNISILSSQIFVLRGKDLLEQLLVSFVVLSFSLKNACFNDDGNLNVSIVFGSFLYFNVRLGKFNNPLLTKFETISFIQFEP
jgi:hypothetical protein